MYRFAQMPSCRHQALAMHFNERIGACQTSCDRCTGRDALLEAHRETQRQIGQTGQTGRTGRTGHAKRPPEKTAPAPQPHESDADRPPFEELRKLRRRIADEKGLPAYIVFADATLKAMAAHRPQTEEGLLAIPGVGNRKLEQYGEMFLDVLRSAAADGRGPRGTQ
jgi:ATP-dependent DNA helicase RecQ